ncbi:unnamed protein product, partial [marine sediment metagenome]
TSDAFTISHNGNYIGRVGIGQFTKLGTAVTKEIGFYSTNQNRLTLSGQVIPGAGGYTGRRASVNVPYKIIESMYNDMDSAYAAQIGKGFPYFIRFDDEAHKFPASMARLYGQTKNPLSMLQSSIYQFKYSYKF